MTVETIDTAPRAVAAATLAERHWRMAAIALLSVRLIQGFIYWGGGSRRFIYGPEKLNPDAPSCQPLETWNTETLARLPADAVPQ
jgi:hypothetical protein